MTQLWCPRRYPSGSNLLMWPITRWRAHKVAQLPKLIRDSLLVAKLAGAWMHMLILPLHFMVILFSFCFWTKGKPTHSLNKQHQPFQWCYQGINEWEPAFRILELLRRQWVPAQSTGLGSALCPAAPAGLSYTSDWSTLWLSTQKSCTVLILCHFW